MARDLMATSADFREAVEACDVHLAPLTGWRAADHLASGSVADPDDLETAYVIHFVVQHALTAVWRGLGVEPDIVAGHSQGEVAAACASGALSLEAAVRLVVGRSRALAAVSGSGAMAFAEIGVEDARRRMARFDGRLSVAVVNTPGSVVVAGEADDVDDLLLELDDEDVVCGLLEAPLASHSALMDGAMPAPGGRPGHRRDASGGRRPVRLGRHGRAHPSVRARAGLLAPQPARTGALRPRAGPAACRRGDPLHRGQHPPRAQHGADRRRTRARRRPR